MAKVWYSLARTINQGNYENAKFEYGIELTCEPDFVDETYEIAKEIVRKQVEEEEAKWRL